MDCSSEYVEDIESKQQPTVSVVEEQLTRKKKRRSRHMTMKYDDMSKMCADIEAAKELSEGKRVGKVEVIVGCKAGEGHKEKPVKENNHTDNCKPMEKVEEQEKLKSCLKRQEKQEDQFDHVVENNRSDGKEKKVCFSDEVMYCEDAVLIKTKKKRKFHSLHRATMIIEKKKAVLAKSMEKLVKRHKEVKLELLEAKESAGEKTAEIESLKVVLSGKTAELYEREDEIACIKANVTDLKANVSVSLQNSVTKLGTVMESFRADMKNIERKLAQRWRIVGKKKLLAEKQKLAAMLDTICTTSQILQEDAVLLDTFKF